MRVFKIMNRHIDLDHVAAISEPEFVDRMGSGGYFIEFVVSLLLRDEPLVFVEELTSPNDYTFESEGSGSGKFRICLVDGEVIDSHDLTFDREKQNQMVAMRRFRENHWDPLYQAWVNKP